MITRVVFSIIAFVTLAGPASASVSSLATRQLLERLLIQRCLHFGSMFQRTTWDCARMTIGMIRDLDADITFEKFDLKSSASFRSELKALLPQPKVSQYLEETALFAESNYDSPDAANLWQWTLRYVDQDRARALQWLAVLLQDSSAGAHVIYLRDLGPKSVDAAVLEKLEGVGRSLNNSDAFSYFPIPLRLESKAQYHFYVIAYLAHKLNQRYPGSKLAFVLPMLFNTTYEYARYIAKNPIVGLVSSPKPFDREKFKDMLEDTYMGYAGALWALGREKEINDFNTFSRSFSSNPEGYLEAILRNGK